MSWEDRRIDRLKGLEGNDVASFKAAAIDTAGAAVDEYQASEESNLAALALKVGKRESNTAAVLGPVLADAAEALTMSWLSRHWADVTVLAVAVSLLSMLLWVPVESLVHRSTGSPAAPQVFAARDISAGSVVGPADLRVTGASSSAAADIAAVLAGGLATDAISAGAPIKAGMLAGKLPEGRLFTLTVDHMPALTGHHLPLDIDLVFSSRQSAPAGAVFRVKLLEASPAAQPAVITFRLPAKDLAEAAKWIGSSDVTVTVPEP